MFPVNDAGVGFEDASVVSLFDRDCVDIERGISVDSGHSLVPLIARGAFETEHFCCLPIVQIA